MAGWALVLVLVPRPRFVPPVAAGVPTGAVTARDVRRVDAALFAALREFDTVGDLSL